MSEPIDPKRLGRVLGAVLLVGGALWLRIRVSTLGANFDFGSYLYVSDCVLRGGNPYVESDRYNYAPGWFLILAALRRLQLALAPENRALFHALIAGVLGLADVALAAIGARIYGGRWIFAACVLLSPVSILITGYQSQFDVLAIVPALCAVHLLSKPGTRAAAGASALFGLSLVIKHVALLLPILVLLEPRFGSFRRRFAFCAAGGAIFAVSFLPWAGGGGAAAIVRRVFGYAPVHEGALLPWLLGSLVPAAAVPVAAKVALLAGIVAAALVLRRVRAGFALPLYLLALFGASPAIADQYLAVPVLSTAVFRRRIAAMLLIAVSTVVVLTSGSNVGALPEMSAFRDRLGEFPHAAAQAVALALLAAVAMRPGREAA